jgi:hypothetical protein
MKASRRHVWEPKNLDVSNVRNHHEETEQSFTLQGTIVHTGTLLYAYYYFIAYHVYKFVLYISCTQDVMQISLTEWYKVLKEEITIFHIRDTTRQGELYLKFWNIIFQWKILQLKVDSQ